MQSKGMSQKDFWYIIAFLVLVIIFLTVLFFGRRNDVVNYFGFAGTLISIVLSVLAIIYAFYQTASSSEQTQTLTRTAQQISGVTDEVVKASRSLNDIGEQLRVTAAGFQQSQEKLADTVDQTMKRHVDNLRDIWFSESKGSVAHGPGGGEGTNSFLRAANAGAIMVMYMLSQQSKKPVGMPLHKLIGQINDRIADDFYKIPIDYVYGFLNGMRLTNLVSYEYRPSFRVELPAEFTEAVETEYQRKIDEAKHEEATKLAAVREAILAQFEG